MVARTELRAPSLRRWLRRHLPAGLRVRVRLVRRAAADRLAGLRFAARTGGSEARTGPFPFSFARYRIPFIDYPGQERQAAAKRNNHHVMASALDRTVIAPGEVFSLWRCAGEPTAERGYQSAATIKAGTLTEEVGGAVCLMSTVLYNTALLGGMQILERWNHSIDLYGDARYFELGRDATVEYAYRDLRFRNAHPYPVMLRVATDGDGVAIWLDSPRPPPPPVELTVRELDAAESPDAGPAVETVRRVSRDGRLEIDYVSRSEYIVPRRT